MARCRARCRGAATRSTTICQGAYALKAPDGQAFTFAGDRTKLYRVSPGSDVLDDVSGGTYATSPIPLGGGHWSMTSFGSRIIATNGVDPIQTLLLGRDQLRGSPAGRCGAEPPVAAAPIARYVATVKDFLFVGNTTDPVDGPVPYRVWWSAINNVQSWPTPGSVEAQQVMSDYQDLQQTDLGNVTQLVSWFAPGSDVVIFCERGIYSASFTGPPLLFNFRVAQGSSGTMSPRSVVQSFARDNCGALAAGGVLPGGDGFAAFDGATSFPIGAQKFDRLFWRELDDTYLSYVQGINDPRTHSVIWGFATARQRRSDLPPDRLQLGVGQSLLHRIGAGAVPGMADGGDVRHELTISIIYLPSMGDLDTLSPSFRRPVLDRQHGKPALVCSTATTASR